MPWYATGLLAALLAGCTSPELVGQRVGQSLYNASVDTGHALAVAGDRAGFALQSAGTHLRDAVGPPPPPDAPMALPLPYAPGDPAPVTATPLAPAY